MLTTESASRQQQLDEETTDLKAQLVNARDEFQHELTRQAAEFDDRTTRLDEQMGNERYEHQQQLTRQAAEHQTRLNAQAHSSNQKREKLHEELDGWIHTAEEQHEELLVLTAERAGLAQQIEGLRH